MRSAMQTHNTEGSQVLHAMNEMQQMTSNVSSSATSMLNNTKNISDDISRLAFSNDTINSMIQSMLSALEELKAAVGTLSALGDKNSENITAVVADISKFKV